jgi:hypothetical protein
VEAQDKYAFKKHQVIKLIDEVRLRRIAVDEGVPVGTIEKDLAITCALKVISQTHLEQFLVFKGGTAIKKLYQPEARFSEDMDFTAINLREKNAIDTLNAINNTQVDSVSFETIQEDAYTRQGKNYKLNYTGPQEYRNSIRIDLSFRPDIIEPIIERPVHSNYGDSLSSSVKALNFTELMAEKIRAMMTRESPRDYYDAWAHLNKLPDRGYLRQLVIKKCELTEYEYNPENILPG